MIENPQLHQIFLMLQEDLHDSDIHHCSTIHARIIEVWDEHLDGLEKGMKVWKWFAEFPQKDFHHNGHVV